MHSKLHARQHKGFSLVELLIVITILGVIAAIAVVGLSDVGASAKVTTAQSQAQRIASVFAAGFAAGAPGFTGTSSVSGAMNAVGAGSVGSGTTRTAWFQLAGIFAGMDAGKPLTQQAQHYLSWEEGMLVYNPDGGGSTGSYSSFDEWMAAMNAAMMQFLNQNPNAGLNDLMAFHGSWIQNHPQPQQHLVLN